MTKLHGEGRPRFTNAKHTDRLAQPDPARGMGTEGCQCHLLQYPDRFQRR